MPLCPSPSFIPSSSALSLQLCGPGVELLPLPLHLYSSSYQNWHQQGVLNRVSLLPARLIHRHAVAPPGTGHTAEMASGLPVVDLTHPEVIDGCTYPGLHTTTAGVIVTCTHAYKNPLAYLFASLGELAVCLLI